MGLVKTAFSQKNDSEPFDISSDLCPFENMKSAKIWGTLHPFFEGGEIMGRSVANEGFIRALLRKDPFDAYHFFLVDEEQKRILSTRIRCEYPDMWEEGRFVIETVRQLPAALQSFDYHCFHLSDCIVHPAHLARLRNAVSRQIFPITGVTHSLSYARYASAFLTQLWQGTTGRDAIVATSRAAESMVDRVFSQLRQGYHLDTDNFFQPEVTRIPLGVEADDFPYAASTLRTDVREQLSASSDDVVLLVLARISQSSKMDVVPLLRAIQRLQAAQDGGTEFVNSLVVVIAGYVQDGDEMPLMLRTMAKHIGVRLTIVPTPSDEQRSGLYAAADIFVSPSDNIQETFGLTLLEAGASGLPVIASDFDGYRDLIVSMSDSGATDESSTGYLIPTVGPAVTTSIDMMASLVFDTVTHLDMAQQTAVDVPALATAIRRLGENAGLRKKLGENARNNVIRRYTWDAIILQYLDLWERLNEVPVDIEGIRSQVHPQHMVYSDMFGQYPSSLLSDEMELVWSTTGQAVYRGKEFPVIYGGIAENVDVGMLHKLLFLSRKPTSVHLLREQMNKAFQEQSIRLQEATEHEVSSSEAETLVMASCTDYSEQISFLILWALKQDLIERRDASCKAGD